MRKEPFMMNEMNNNEHSLVVDTKYNIGDKVWFIDDNQVMQLDITGFSVQVKEAETVVTYTLHYGMTRPEENLFPTKEELLNSL